MVTTTLFLAEEVDYIDFHTTNVWTVPAVQMDILTDAWILARVTGIDHPSEARIFQSRNVGDDNDWNTFQ